MNVLDYFGFCVYFFLFENFVFGWCGFYPLRKVAFWWRMDVTYNIRFMFLMCFHIGIINKWNVFRRWLHLNIMSCYYITGGSIIGKSFFDDCFRPVWFYGFNFIFFQRFSLFWIMSLFRIAFLHCVVMVVSSEKIE